MKILVLLLDRRINYHNERVPKMAQITLGHGGSFDSKSILETMCHVCRIHHHHLDSEEGVRSYKYENLNRLSAVGRRSVT
jgi:hypothetical protein